MPVTLPSGVVSTLTAANFTAAVAAPPPALVVVAFKVPWCGHCQALTAPFAEAAGRLATAAPTVRLAHVDASAAANAALNTAHVTVGYPTIKAFSAGALIDEFRGVRDARRLVGWVAKVLHTAGRSPVIALGADAAGGGGKGKRRGAAADTLDTLLAEGPPLVVLFDRTTASPALAAAFEAAVPVLRGALDLPLARFASTARLDAERAAVAPAQGGDDAGVALPPVPPPSADDVAVVWRRSPAYGSTTMHLVGRLRRRDATAIAAGSLDAAPADGAAVSPPPDDAVAALAAWAYAASVRPADVILLDAANAAALTGAPALVVLAFGPTAQPTWALAAVLGALPRALHPPAAMNATAVPGVVHGTRSVGRVAYAKRGAFPDLVAQALAGADAPPSGGTPDAGGSVDWVVYRRGVRRLERSVFGRAAYAAAVSAAGANEVAATAALARMLAAWASACAAGALDGDPLTGVVHGADVAPSGNAYVALAGGAAAASAPRDLRAAAGTPVGAVRQLAGVGGWRPWVDDANGLVVAWLVPPACRDGCAAVDTVMADAAVALGATTDAVSVVRLAVGGDEPPPRVPLPLAPLLTDGRLRDDAPALVLLSPDPAVSDVVLRGEELAAAAASAEALVRRALAAVEPLPVVDAAAAQAARQGRPRPLVTRQRRRRCWPVRLPTRPTGPPTRPCTPSSCCSAGSSPPPPSAGWSWR